MSDEKKKSNLSPEAARILEQYRNAGKKATNADGSPVDDEGNASRPNTPPPMQPMRRSGTRGK